MSQINDIDVSIVIPVYNVQPYLRECIDSILDQEDVSIECICVDDASTDHSYEILEEYRKADNRVKVIRNAQNRGLASTRNIGFRHAKGEFLYCIDGDDYLQKGALKRLYDCAKTNELELLGFSGTSFFEKKELECFGKENEYVRKNEYSDVLSGPELFARLIENDDRASSNIVLYFYRRDYFEKNNLYCAEGIRYVDDSMFAMYMAAKRALCISDRLYMRRYREGSAVTSPMKKSYLESMIVLFWRELQIWEKSYLTARVNESIEKYFNMRLKQIRVMYNKFINDSTNTPLLDKNIVAKYFYKYFIEEIPAFADCLDKELITVLQHSENVVLYGAGQIANEVAKALEYVGIYSYFVAVSEKQHNNITFRNKEIFGIEELVYMREQCVVIVAMSRKNQDLVMDKLRKLEFKNIYWIAL